MKQYQSPDMQIEAFVSEDVLEDSLILPSVPLSLRRSGKNSDLKNNGSYDIF